MVRTFSSVPCLLASWLLLAPAPGLAQPAADRASEVVVSGEGVVKAAPDLAWVVVAVERRSKNPKDAQAGNAKAMNAVVDALAAAGVARDAIRTLAYDLQMEADWVDGKRIPRGYLARNTVEVRVDDIGRVGELIDVAVGAGATNVHHVRFDLKQREAIERDALKRATADARARAEAAAAGVGATLGRIVRIEEPAGRPIAPPMPMMATREAALTGQAEPTPVNPGEIEIRVTVRLTATLK